MIPVVDTSLFELVNLPETIEKLVFPSHEQGRRDNRQHHDRGHHHHHQSEEKRVPVDILESSRAYTFFLDVPGLSKSDIQVAVEDGSVLVIRSSGKRKREEGEEECRYLRLERKAAASPSFARKFRIPEDCDAEKITARCDNGELRVTVEKRPPPEAPKPKTVEVAVA